MHTEVFDEIVNCAAKWFCKSLKLQYPDEDSQLYLKYQKQALIILRSELLNDQHLSALELAAKCGAVELVEKMVQIHKIFATKKKDMYQYDVTDLLPDTIVNKVFDDVSVNENQGLMKMHRSKSRSPSVFHVPESSKHIPNIKSEKNTVSLLSVVVKAKPLNVANEMLNIVPLRQIVTDYWVIYQYIYGILMIVHVTYMTLYSIYGIPAARDAAAAHIAQINNATLDTTATINNAFIAFLPWPALLLVYQIYYFILRVYRCARKLDHEEPAFAEIEGDLYSLSNLPMIFMSLLLFYLPNIASLSFSALILLWFRMYYASDSYQAYILASCLLIGWLMTINFSHGFEAVHGFTQMLSNIFVRDVVRFFFLYMYILLAFGFAFEALIQLSGDLQAEFPDTGRVFQQTFGMMIGAGDLMVEDIEVKFSKNGYNAAYYKFLYLTYALVTVVVLLNLLIAMMSDSYTEVKEREGTSYRVESIAMAINLENSIPILPKIFTVLGFKHRNIDYDENTGRYMMTLRREEAEEILEDDLDYTEKMLHKLDGKLDRLRETQDEIWDMVDVLGSRVSKLEKDAADGDEGHDDDDDDDDDDDGGGGSGDDDDSPGYVGNEDNDDDDEDDEVDDESDDQDDQGRGEGKLPFRSTLSAWSESPKNISGNGRFTKPPDGSYPGSDRFKQIPDTVYHDSLSASPNETYIDSVMAKKRKNKTKQNKSVEIYPLLASQNQDGPGNLELIESMENYPPEPDNQKI